MEKHEVLAKFYSVNNQIQEYRIKKNKERAETESETPVSGLDTLEKFSGNARRILILLLSKENINQRSIAKLMDISSQAVSETIKKLQQNGCVEKTNGTQNNENIIQITDFGKEVAKMFEVRIKNHAEQVFAEMSEAEIRNLYELLSKMQTQ